MALPDTVRELIGCVHSKATCMYLCRLGQGLDCF